MYVQCMYENMSRAVKNERLNIRVRSDVKEEFAKVAEARGLSVSALIQHLMLQAIKEEKAQSPDLFAAEPERSERKVGREAEQIEFALLGHELERLPPRSRSKLVRALLAFIEEEKSKERKEERKSQRSL